MNTPLNLRLAALAYSWMPGEAAHEWANNVAFYVALEPPRSEVRARRVAHVMLLRRIERYGLRLLGQTGRRAHEAARSLARLAAGEIMAEGEV